MNRFEDFARAHGVLIDHAIGDGRIHRAATEAHPRKKNGSYKWTGEWGWVQSWEEHERPIIFKPDHVPAHVVRRDMAAARAEEAALRRKSAEKARKILARCRVADHPYLARKGFPEEDGFVDIDGRLVIPMRDAQDYRRVNSIQWIAEDGAKQFLYGGQARGSVFMRGTGSDTWLCEGYATGLSISAALGSMYRQARVVVCFSAHNVAHVAGLLSGRRFVVGDNDPNGVGARYAASTGLPWAVPPEVGMDANDLHQKHGVRALVDLMRPLMR
jgi:putative DNA primase/helicase